MGAASAGGVPGAASSPFAPSYNVILLAAALALPAGVLSGLGLGAFGLAGIPVLVGCALGLLGEVPLFLFVTMAVSGVGFYWTESGLAVAGRDINLSGLHWGLMAITAGVLLLRKRPERLPRPLVLYGGYLALATAAVVYAPDWFQAIKELVMMGLPLLMAMVVLAHVRTDAQIRLVMSGYWVALVVGVAVALGMWVAGARGIGLSGGVGTRTFAMFLLPIMALALGSMRHRSGAFVWVAVGIVLVTLATLSRTALVVMLVLPLFATRGVRPLGRLAMAGLAALLVLGAWNVEAFRERFGDRQVRVSGVEVQGQGRDASLSVGTVDLSGRGWLWFHTGRHALESPVIGHGTGSSTVYLEEVPGSPATHPHNDYLRVFHDQGAVGLLAILVFGLGTLVHFGRLHRDARDRRTRRLALASYLATLAYGAMAVTDNPIVYATFFTHNIFILYALTEISRRASAGDVGAAPRAVHAA